MGSMSEERGPGGYKRIFFQDFGGEDFVGSEREKGEKRAHEKGSSGIIIQNQHWHRHRGVAKAVLVGDGDRVGGRGGGRGSPARPRRVLFEVTVAGYGRGGGEFVVQSWRPWVREDVSWRVGMRVNLLNP
ncbi:hypothetical protein LR48_Vigan03g119700 [Vigna angularis]|uniref:Uncharacterized protein n=1 Tax=Phaseolus angularis TaxID=3914 RepID=A0A0L9U4V4_PHAAN|nr:hypothetical protein LR48_Vigan03g119700 [Vigna angularis]